MLIFQHWIRKSLFDQNFALLKMYMFQFLPEMSCDKQYISAKLHIVLLTLGHYGAWQRHFLNKDRESVAGGWKIQLQVTFELVPHPTSRVLHQEAGVEGEHGHHLLLHVDPGLLLMDIADLVQSEIMEF